MRATLYDTAPPDAVLDAAVDVYAAAFGRAPYFETAEQAESFREQVHRYAAERAGFRLVTVEDDGAMRGIGMAVLAYPGMWWREKVAADLTPADADRWLGPKCLEVVEVAVAPGAHGRGLGKLVHDVLISGSPAPTAALICHPEAKVAQRLYSGRGWHLIGRNERGSWLMARDL